METLRQDMRYAIRALRKSPAFTAIAVLTLALGIGANTAIFSVINAVLLRDLPVKNPQELVVLSDPESAGMQNGVSTGEREMFSFHEFEGLREQNNVFSGMFATHSNAIPAPVSLNSSEQGSPANILLASGGYFSILGAEPMEGRTFGTEVDAGLDAHPVAVVSYSFWQRRMQQAPDAIGRQLRIRQKAFDIIGVMPPEFTGVKVGESPDVWIPLQMASALYPGRDILKWNPGSVTKTLFLQVFGRMKPGVRLNEANSSINVTYKQILQYEAGTLEDASQRADILNATIRTKDARHGISVVRGEYAHPLNILMGMVGLLLLLACANVANLLLAKATGRNREMAVRVAMGAGRRRLIQQLITESMLVAAMGGALGLLLARWADTLLLRMVSSGPTLLPLDVHPDVKVLSFTILATALTGVLFGLAPALRATRVDLNQVLRGASRSISGGEGNTRLPMGKVLVAAQVAISLVLIVTAGLFVRSLRNLTTTSLGYDPEQMLVFRVFPSTAGYRGSAQIPLLQDLTRRFASIPGVRGVALSENGLFFGRESADQITILGQKPKPGLEMHAMWDEVGPNYFSTIGIPVLMGRDVSEHDSSGAHMCWVNQTFAKYYFGDQNPVGVQIRDDYPETIYTCEIAGVVADAKYNSVREKTPRRFYVAFFNPIEQPGDATFEVRFAGSGSAISSTIREAIRQTNGNIDPPVIRTIPLQIDAQLVRDRLTARLSTFFGIVAILLACIGLYGVVSYNVVRRTSEMGIRMALGAQRGSILNLVLRESLLVTGIGAVIGLGAAIGATRIVQSMLFGLNARDPLTFGGATLLLVAVAVLAAAIPAWRASRVDPMTALRYE
jgi:predicted permease